MSDLFGNTKQPAANKLLAVFDAEHRAHFDGTPAPIIGKKDGPLAARLLKRYDFKHLSAWAHLYFEIPDHFIQNGGYTFGVFSSCIGKVIQYERRRARPRLEMIPEQDRSSLLELRAHVDHQNHLTTIEAAEDYYRRKPWVPRVAVPPCPCAKCKARS